MSAAPIDEALAVGAPAQAAPAPPAAPLLTGRRAALRGSDTVKAAGLAVATIGANLVAVLFTMFFTRILGTESYGSLAALLNLTVILFVPGSALQVAAARQGALGRLGRGGELAATLRRWNRHLLAGMAAVAVVAVAARAPLAAALNVREQWAAAAVPVTGALWLLLCVQRGLLQAKLAYRQVGLSVVLEAAGRLAMALLFVAAGLGVTGAYLGTLASLAIAAGVLERVLRRRLGPPTHDAPPHPLRALAADARLPIVALTLVAALQNIDVIVAKHVLPDDDAGVYAAATVAAKAIVWIAVGIGLWVLPEAARRGARHDDARPVLLRALGLVAVIAAVALAAFATIPGLLLRLAFGAQYQSGETILLALGAAYALLAAGYVTVQYLLALRRRAFVLALAVVAAAEAVLLAHAHDFARFATVVMAVQAAGALVLLAHALLERGAGHSTPARAATRSGSRRFRRAS